MNEQLKQRQQPERKPIHDLIDRRRKEVEEVLFQLLPQSDGPTAPLNEAMRYPVKAGGKRVRPFLTLAAVDFCRGVSGEDVYAGKSWDGVDPDLKRALLTTACSVEFIHTYSLVHDDLPCMDDDDLRRGKPTCHVVYGEAMAVLAADALQTLGFQVLAELPETFALQALRAARELAIASGQPGMVAGQAVDMEYESKPGTEEILEFIHLHKTAALLRAALRMGAQMISASKRDLEILQEYGTRIGLIFQVVDDILDVVGAASLMGKQPGSDEAQGKLTYPSLIGLDESRKRVDILKNEILNLLEPEGGRATVLIDFTHLMTQRDK